MEISKENKILFLIYFGISLVLFSAAVVTLSCLIDGFNVGLLTIGISSAIGCAWCTFGYYAAARNFKIKYILFTKNYKTQIKSALKFLNTDDKKFVSKFVKKAKNNYKIIGEIFYASDLPSIKPKDDDYEVFVRFYTDLNECVKSRSGLEEFFDVIEKHELTLSQKLKLTYNDMLSFPFIYYLRELYKLTMLTFHDNKLCEQFTQLNDKNKQIVKNVYDPMLLNFEQEISEIVEKLKYQQTMNVEK